MQKPTHVSMDNWDDDDDDDDDASLYFVYVV